MKRSHILLMLLCCLLPIAGLAAVYLFKVPANSVVYSALAFACPIAMAAMMVVMFKGHTSPDPKGLSSHSHQEMIDSASRENNPS